MSVQTAVGALACVACVVTSAGAVGNRWTVTVHHGFIQGPGDYAEISVYARYASGDYAFAAGEFSVTAEDPYGMFSDVHEYLGGPGASAGIADGPTVTGIVTGQLHLPGDGVFADTSNPLLVWTAKYTTTDFSWRTIFFDTDTSLYDVYTDPLGTRESGLGDFHEGHSKAQVCLECPAPGVGAVLAFGSCCGAARRRRR